MRTMRSVVADTVGEPSEVLHLQTRPIPEPGPGQVRIRVATVPDPGVLRVPEGQPIPVEKFSEAVYLAEAAAHGGKPLLVFEP
jgi:hypothetical protein